MWSFVAHLGPVLARFLHVNVRRSVSEVVNVNRTLAIIGAAAVGAGIVYATDPAVGKRRRALLRDAVVHGTKVFGRAVDVSARDTAHRLKGIIAVSKRVLDHEHVSHGVLADRIRTEIGRVSSHP